MSEPNEWAKSKAGEIVDHHVCDTDDCCGLYTDYKARIAAALEEAAQRERGACHAAAVGFSERTWCDGGCAGDVADLIAERGPMLAPDSRRGAD